MFDKYPTTSCKPGAGAVLSGNHAGRRLTHRVSCRIPDARRLATYLWCIGAVVVLNGCGETQSEPKITDRQVSDADADADAPARFDVQRLISSEEMILDLTKRLKHLNRSAMNLKLPSGPAMELFADPLVKVDAGAEIGRVPVNEYVSQLTWEIEPSQTGRPEFWQNLLDQIRYFETAKFYFVNGQFNETRERFDAEMGFSGHARMKDGESGIASARIKTTWGWSGPEQKQLQILKWSTQQLKCLTSESRLFQDVTDDCILDGKLAQQLATSKHDEINRALIKGEGVKLRKGERYPYFFPEVTLEHPGVSVVDLNEDGFDDFFLTRPHQSSLFFMNNGDGTFSEVGEEWGLDFEEGCTCSLFADFDNDGDQDVFIGRSRDRAVYMENFEGRFFTDATAAEVEPELPYMVSSIAAADYNNDGLLDIYFSTYSPIEGSQAAIAGKSGYLWSKLFFNDNERLEFERRLKNSHPFINMVGPPNLLLENRADKFVTSPYNETLSAWRKTFQASWSDYDDDGDPDLYVCNDFSPDDLYRNDGEQGFRRVNEEVGLTRLGFGMGVSWGDFNGDGKFDLYVSNMYSKAGKRITEQVDGLDPVFKDMAEGNYLWEQRDDRFELVSAPGDEHQVVSKAGWAWGGQFNDFDNDGKLDIYVASGYYTAPPELAEQVDL